MATPALLRFMAWPGSSQRTRMARVLADARLDRRLGPLLFAPTWWHQSLSLAYEDDRDTRARLVAAGDALSARGVTLTFDRIASTGGTPGSTHWAFRPHRDAGAFAALTDAMGDALAGVGRPQSMRPTPHVTFCYRGPSTLKTMTMPPIDWPIDEVHLVVRRPRPFGYDVIASWPLSPASRAARQPSLPFDS